MSKRPGRRNGSKPSWPAKALTITPDAKEHIWSAITSLASAPVAERTLTGLSVLLQSNALKQALRPYCLGGPFGRLLDAEAERLGVADVQAVRDGRPHRQGRGTGRSRLSLPSDRRPARWTADAPHHRRRLARARRHGFRAAAARMAEDAAQEECVGHLRHAIARRYRDERDRARPCRELPDANLPAE